VIRLAIVKALMSGDPSDVARTELSKIADFPARFSTEIHAIRPVKSSEQQQTECGPSAG
jgi:hypothetical protein